METNTQSGDSTRCKQYQQELGGEVLESVSRSFYLTLKALPTELRGSISLGYLLARATDTVADSASLPAARRCELLAEMGAVISGVSAGDALWAALGSEVVPSLSDSGECVLMAHFGDACGWLASVPEAERLALRRVLGHIVRGQSLDTSREPSAGEAVSQISQISQLQTAAELDEYAYLVAGSVGEFWTEICDLKMANFPGGGRDLAEMRELGSRFGKGLQLINILRDLPEDLANGRCYLPADEMLAVGANPQAVLANPAGLLEFARPWMGACEGHLDAGLQYLEGCEARRLRYATALPLMLAVRTLSLLKQADWEDYTQRVKIGRSEVSKIMAKTMFAAGSTKKLAGLYRELRG